MKKKKKKFPFYSKAAGGLARRRPDRKATGGVTPAPKAGKVEQKFAKGGLARGAFERMRPEFEAGGKGSYGGYSFRKNPRYPSEREPEESTAPSPKERGMESIYTPGGSTGYRKAIPRPDEPTEEKRGGSVKKRQGGGDVPLPTPDPRTRDFIVNRMEKEIPNLVDDPMKVKTGDIDRFGRKYGFGTGARERDEPANVGRSEGLRRSAAERGFLKGYKSGGHLTAGERQAMPKSDFALPGKGKGPKGAGSGSYPIPDEGHAKAALSRGAQHASPSELATIKRKVKAKFPSMDVGGE